MLFRYNNIANEFTLHYKAKEQQHSFNFPYQIGSNGDNPEKAIKSTHDISHNDILIIASDG